MCLHPQFSGTHIRDMYESLISGVGPDGQLWRGPTANAVLDAFNFDAGNKGQKVQEPLRQLYKALELAYVGLETGKLRTLRHAGFVSDSWSPVMFEPYYSKDPEIKAAQRGNAGFASEKDRGAIKLREALFTKFNVNSVDDIIDVGEPTAEVLTNRDQLEVDQLRSAIRGIRGMLEPMEQRLAELESTSLSTAA